jgi:phosphoglucan, water dikinase
MIIFLDQADGTEEIPSDQVQAIILRHDLPQLSHLAIRARQTKIMMICCENQNIYNQMKSQNVHESVKEIKLSEGKIEIIDS